MRTRSRPPPDLRAAALTLAWGAFTHRFVPERVRPTLGVAAALGLAALVANHDADWRDLGCDRRDLPAGLLWGAGAAGAIGAATAVASALDRNGTAFRDARVSDASNLEAAGHLLIRIPIATALAEELVFRGVILGLGLRRHDRRRALIVSAVTFGLWHVGAALHPERQQATAGLVGDRLAPTPVVVLGDVAVTTIAGFGLGWLRLRSGSIAAPVMAHAAINGSAYLATRLSGGALRRAEVS